MLIVVALAVMLGAISQRIAGMGFALVAAPLLVLLIGPFEGVLMVNLAGAISASIVVTRVWRSIDWKQYALLAIPAVLAVVPGSLIAIAVSGPTLQVTVGVILVAALTTSLLASREHRSAAPLPAGIIAGTASGLMSATAGISGPAIGIFAVATHWEQRSFAATVQPFFVTLGLAAFTTKVVLSGSNLPSYDIWLWVTVIGSTIVGLGLSELLAGRISARFARITVIVICYVGAIAAIFDGVFNL